MAIQGLHHITLICSNAQRTIDFYTRILGLRLLKQTVNFDNPGSYHLYFGDRLGRPGTLVAFFEWPGAPRGAPGIGGTHHFALCVASHDGLLKWKRWLTDQDVRVEGPLDRRYYSSLSFRDLDGTPIELATRGPGWTVDEPVGQIGMAYRQPSPHLAADTPDVARQQMQAQTWPHALPGISADMALENGLHHITAICSDIRRTHAFYCEVLGMRRVKMTAHFDQPDTAHWYWGVGEGEPGTLVTYFERSPTRGRPEHMGAGQAHHFALCVPDEPALLEWRVRLAKAGLQVSPVMDRVYFKSIYTNDPDGHVIELATAGPGFAVDEDAAHLGQSLKLPPWLEQHRAEIAAALRPITVPVWEPPPTPPW